MQFKRGIIAAVCGLAASSPGAFAADSSAAVSGVAPETSADDVVRITVTAADLRSESWKEATGEESFHITIDADVTEIPDYAFAGCAGLRSVSFAPGSAAVSIGEGAFSGCESLQRVDLPSGLITLGTACFYGCSSLRNIDIPAGVRTIPKSAFEWCVSLRSVTLPDRLTEIKGCAFEYCHQLQGITIPASVTRVASNAFSCCYALQELRFPADAEVESYVASECTSLRSVTLPANGKMLGELMFSGCRMLREIIEPSAKVPVFDCGSFIFEPDEEALYRQCRLYVPAASAERYRNAPGWNLFSDIAPIP